MWNKNRITKKLGITYPIIQAGMAGGVTTPELIAAVSNAGGLGTLGAGYMKAEGMKDAIVKIRELTDLPFGVNLFIPELPDISDKEIQKANDLLQPYREKLKVREPAIEKLSTKNFEKQLEVIIQEKVPVCSFTFGVLPKDKIQQLKQEGIIVIGTATTVKEAIINEEYGMDMVVMQGSEAGGHRGTFTAPFTNAMIGTMSLVPQTVDAIQIPVIAAGGIMDGRGVLASLILGAEAVQMGTAFVTTLESGAGKQHINAILNSTEDETVTTKVFSGKLARGIENDFIKEMRPYEHVLPGYPIMNTLTRDIRSEAAKQSRREWIHLWSGQSPRMSKQQHAKDLILNIVSQIGEIENNK